MGGALTTSQTSGQNSINLNANPTYPSVAVLQYNNPYGTPQIQMGWVDDYGIWSISDAVSLQLLSVNRNSHAVNTVNNTLDDGSGGVLFGSQYSEGSFVYLTAAETNTGYGFFGIYDAYYHGQYYGISPSMPMPSGTAGFGGFFSGMALQGSTTAVGTIIFNVGDSAGNTTLNTYDTGQVGFFCGTNQDLTGSMPPIANFYINGNLAVGNDASYPSITPPSNGLYVVGASTLDNGNISTDGGGNVYAPSFNASNSINSNGNVNVGGHINNDTYLYTMAGTYTGTVRYCQPEQGTSYKKFLIRFDGYTNASSRTVTFDTPFVKAPFIYGTAAITALLTTTTTTLTITAATAVTGFAFVEGY